MTKQTGTVKFYNKAKGYAFVSPDDGGKGIVVTIKAIDPAEIGGRVTFDSSSELDVPGAIFENLGQHSATVIRKHAQALANCLSSIQLDQLHRIVAEAMALPENPNDGRPHTPEDLRAGLEFFRERLDDLEERHFNSYIAIDVDDGRFAIGASATDAVGKFRSEHGEGHTFTFHIGTTR